MHLVFAIRLIWILDICRSSQPADMTAFAEHLKNHYVPNSVIVDSTASEVPAAHYLEWMQKGLHIITPNKKLNSGPLEQYLALRQFQRESYIHYFYEVCTAFVSHTVHTRRSGLCMMVSSQSRRCRSFKYAGNTCKRQTHAAIFEGT